MVNFCFLGTWSVCPGNPNRSAAYVAVDEASYDRYACCFLAVDQVNYDMYALVFLLLMM